MPPISLGNAYSGTTRVLLLSSGEILHKLLNTSHSKLIPFPIDDQYFKPSRVVIKSDNTTEYRR